MLQDSLAFNGFAVNNVEEARTFYGDTLGLRVSEVSDTGPLARLHLGDRDVLFYEQPSATPASYTFLNFPVADVGAAVAWLAGRGVVFERYDGMPQDDDGVMRGNGPDIAWFRDPSGNVLSVIAAD